MIGSDTRILVTGATGQFGRLVIASLLQRVPARSLIGLAQDAAKAADLTALGIEIREGDYRKPDTLEAAILILTVRASAVHRLER